MGWSPVRAQEAAKTFGTATQVVLLDLVARDKDGAPVLDLQPGEVQVFENDRSCEVASFRLVRNATGPKVATAASPSAQRSDSAGAARPGVVLLVFDQLGRDAAVRAQKAAADLLARPFPAGTSFAVLKTGQGVRMLGPYTTNPGQLGLAIRAATMGSDAIHDAPEGLQTAGAGTLTEQVARQVGTTAAIPSSPASAAGIGGAGPGQVPVALLSLIDSGRRTDRSWGALGSLLAIVKSLQPVEGRKTIVYFAEGLLVTDDSSGLFEGTLDEANRANVTIHAVDARGLTIDRPGHEADDFLDAAGRMSASGVVPETGATGSIADALLGNVQANLGALARATGGLLVANTENAAPALARVAAEVGTYYEVVYTPADPTLDGRFRRITVRVSRHGVTVRTRKGYYASPERSPSLGAYELPLMAALEAPEGRLDFRHQARSLHFAARGAERECVLLVQVPLAGVQLTPDPSTDRYSAHLALLAFVKDAGGRLLTRLTRDWPLEGPLGEMESRRRGSALFRQTVALAPGRYTLETAIQDVASGGVSVARTPFDVPRAESSLGLSSVTLVRRVEPASDPVLNADPLRVNRVLVLPELGDTATAEAGELAYFVTAYPGAGPEPVELDLEVRREGEVKARGTPRIPLADASGRIAHLGKISLQAFGPGRYELVLKARQGSASAEETLAFEVPARLEPAPAAATVPESPLSVLLARAGEYVLGYESSFRNLVAEETYIQTFVSGTQPSEKSHRTTRADLVFVHLTGAIPWASYRDVYEVDGQKLRDRDQRLERLFQNPSPDAEAHALDIVRESARYNIGAERTVNLPTLALLFLHPRNQSRFTFRPAGKAKVNGLEAEQIAFEEKARPTIVERGGEGDLPAVGRFWLQAGTGVVLRSETSFRFKEATVGAGVTTDYAPDPRLAMWVPAVMTEKYWGVLFSPGTEGTARYSNFRRFTVTTEEATSMPAESREGSSPRP